METTPDTETPPPIRGYSLPYPPSDLAYHEVVAATCSGCAQERSGWCGGCETCNMMPTWPHTCAPEAEAVPVRRVPSNTTHTLNPQVKVEG